MDRETQLNILYTAREIDCAVRELITEAMMLLARETLTREELPVLAEHGPAAAASSVNTGARPPLERNPAWFA